MRALMKKMKNLNLRKMFCEQYWMNERTTSAKEKEQQSGMSAGKGKKEIIIDMSSWECYNKFLHCSKNIWATA